MLQRALAALLLAGLCLLPGVPASARATTLTVDVTADSYDGSCADGDCSLRDAVASTVDGDTVELPSGFYALTSIEAGGARPTARSRSARGWRSTASARRARSSTRAGSGAPRSSSTAPTSPCVT